MLIRLIADEEEIKKQNEFYDKWKKEEPDDEFAQNLEHIKSLDDIFLPYEKWLDIQKEDDYIKIPDDREDFTGCYIASLSCDGFLSRLATNKLVDSMEIFEKNRKFYFRDYGVCDNASQAISYYEDLISEGIISVDDKFVITLTPIFAEEHGNWRWKKWGPYVGVQNKSCEYLEDELDIDMIYVFHIYQMR